MYFFNSKNNKNQPKQDSREQRNIEAAARSMLCCRRFFIFERAGFVNKVKGQKAAAQTAIHEERGSQLVEYIAILPMLFIAALIGWQMFMVGHTFIVTANAAREGARALAVCGGGNVQAVADRTSPGYRPEVLIDNRGDRVTTVRIGNDIPKIRIINFLDPDLPQVHMTAKMRTEECR